jgi:osmotically-inducible protein OsmY
MSDRIESSAKKSYVFMTYLKGDDIKIKTTNDGIVTLTGTVSEWSHQSLAEEVVAGLPGVKGVNNNLELKGRQAPENSDAWVRMEVKTMLMFHRNVSNLIIEIDVTKGIVTLHGEASNEAQKELLTEYVKDVEGVQSVKNDMTVEKIKKTIFEEVNEQIDDASITAQVKLALLFHRTTSDINTKVETKNGIVTVRGIAKNTAKNDLMGKLGKLVTKIRGVKGLKNEITIS